MWTHVFGHRKSHFAGVAIGASKGLCYVWRHPGHQEEASGLREGTAEAVRVLGHSGHKRRRRCQQHVQRPGSRLHPRPAHQAHPSRGWREKEEKCPPEASASARLLAPPESCHPQVRAAGGGGVGVGGGSRRGGASECGTLGSSLQPCGKDSESPVSRRGDGGPSGVGGGMLDQGSVSPSDQPLRPRPGAASSPWAGRPEHEQEPSFYHSLANSVVTTEVVQPAKPAIFTVWPFPEVC